ncbi:MAG TPA: amino acid-binding protein [Propionibacteriaceae bacterium]|nr:amino acid-binding protein [Propionibacteriaceae bacterium]
MPEDGGVFLLRITLPDRPGSLGAVATALGGVGGDINAVEIVQKIDGIVIDDFIVDLPPGKLPETIITACHQLEGVRVEWISRYPEGGGLQSDLEALERMTADPPHAAEILASLCPVVFRSHWATLLDVSDERGRLTFATPLAPDLDEDLIKRLAPFDIAHRIDLETGWIQGWGESTVVVTPLKGQRAIAIGRLGGPPFLDSEIARLHHLAALVP